MKIGITGASGLVGFNFCEKALSKGDSLNILIRKDSYSTDNIEAQKFYGDLNNTNVLESFCDGCEVIVHSAAMLSIGFDSYDEVYNVNYTGTSNLLKASKKMNVKKFIYISSINAFNRYAQEEILDERRELVKKGSSYDVTKALAQELVLKTDGIETVSINPSGVVGKNDFKPSKFGKVLRSLHQNKLPFYISGGLDVIDVEDLCKCIYQSIKKGRDKESYLVTGKWRSFKEIITSIRKLQEKKSTVIVLPKFFVKMMIPFLFFFPKKLLKKAAEINGKIYPGLENFSKESIENILNFPKNIDNSKAKKELNLSVSSLDKTIKDCINE